MDDNCILENPCRSLDPFLVNKILSMVPKLELEWRVYTRLLYSPSSNTYTFNIGLDKASNTITRLPYLFPPCTSSYYFQLGHSPPDNRYDYSEISGKLLDFQFNNKIFHLNVFQRNQDTTIQITDEDILHIRGNFNTSVKLYPVDKEQLFQILGVTLKFHHLNFN